MQKATWIVCVCVCFCRTHRKDSQSSSREETKSDIFTVDCDRQEVFPLFGLMWMDDSAHQLCLSIVSLGSTLFLLAYLPTASTPFIRVVLERAYWHLNVNVVSQQQFAWWKTVKLSFSREKSEKCINNNKNDHLHENYRSSSRELSLSHTHTQLHLIRLLYIRMSKVKCLRFAAHNYCSTAETETHSFDMFARREQPQDCLKYLFMWISLIAFWHDFFCLIYALFFLSCLFRRCFVGSLVVGSMVLWYRI